MVGMGSDGSEENGMSIDITINANFGDLSENLDEAILRALERVGSQAEGYAADLAPVDTGRLRNSLTHRVDADKKVYVGTAAEYAAYVEFGTGKYASGGRQTPWVYKDDKGQWHYTHGQRAQPFLKPALQNHIETYRNIIEDELKGD